MEPLGAGTTTTTINKPAAAANWPGNNALRGKVVIIDSGAGSSGNPYLPTVRWITSNTTSSFSFPEILGLASGTPFRLVDVGTTFTSASINAFSGTAACVGIKNNKIKVIIGASKFSGSNVNYGVYAKDSDNVLIDGCDSVANLSIGISNTNVKTAFVSNTWMHSSSYLEAQHCDRVEYTNIMQNSGGIDVNDARYAYVTTNSTECNANALKIRHSTKVQVAATIFSCSATPVVLQNNHHFTLDSLDGYNPGTTTAVEVSKGGQYIFTGATISAATNDFSLEGESNDSWANLSGYGTYSLRGTYMHWGSGRTYVLGGVRVAYDGGDELVVDGDVVWSGAEKSYGYKLSLDNGLQTSAYLHLTAAIGGGFFSASQLGYRYNYVDSLNNATASVVLRFSPAGGADIWAFNVRNKTVCYVSTSRWKNK